MTQTTVSHKRTVNSKPHTKRPRTRARQSTKTRVRGLTGQFQTDVNKEARALGLTTPEYLRLLVALSKSLRQGLLKNQKVDAKALLELAESPVFGGMIQYVAQSAGSLAKSTDDDAEPNSQAPTSHGDQPEQKADDQQPPAQTPQTNQPPYPWPYQQPPVGQPFRPPYPQPQPYPVPRTGLPPGWY